MVVGRNDPSHIATKAAILVSAYSSKSVAPMPWMEKMLLIPTATTWLCFIRDFSGLCVYFFMWRASILSLTSRVHEMVHALSGRGSAPIAGCAPRDRQSAARLLVCACG